jgi:hypothetical protein
LPPQRIGSPYPTAQDNPRGVRSSHAATWSSHDWKPRDASWSNPTNSMECRTTLYLALLDKSKRKKGGREISKAED